MKARPISEYHEDMGSVVWWKFPIVEAPYVGTPNDVGFPVEAIIRDSVRDHKYTTYVGGWPGYHTHFTPIETPETP